jgi:asparagine synthase (glutamine-hydrolysing)
LRLDFVSDAFMAKSAYRMCGICGLVGVTEPESMQTVLRRMMGQMHHRGPDDEGLFADDSVALGMRRLSIIDLDGGHQPVFNEDGTVAVVFNGEIYNFRELRRTLESRGHAFRTASDTEVIVHAYEEWGEDCVDHLEGMFAFALAETSKSTRRGNPRVLLARDRLGIKPLYYALADGNLVFASEVRSLLASGQIEPRLSQPALRSYLLFGSVVEPMTLVEGVYSLPPGHRIVVSAASRHLRIRPEPYWGFAEPTRSSADKKRLDRASAAAFLRLLLEESVESHLTADVPVGVFLSSGIDSTALVALAAQKRAAVHTVTLVFGELEFNEAEVARRTARRFRTRHQELPLSGDDMLARVSEAVAAFDQPSMDGINSYFVSWAARQSGLKVALSGLGGDEVFGGYSTFRSTPGAQSVADLARRIPGRLRSVMASAAERVSKHLSRKDAHRKMAALWRDPNFLPHPYFYTRLLFTPAQVLGLLSCNNGAVALEPWQDWLARTAAESEQLDDFTAVSCLESRSYMANTLLRDTDAMSMAHSLEVRVPFLDHPLVEFVTRLPGSVKSSNGLPKPLLVEAMGDLLPSEVVSQQKRTFTLPWEHWLRGPLKEEVISEFSSVAPSLAGCLDGCAVRQVWTNFLQRDTSWSRVWSLFVLSKWIRRHLDG